MRGDSRKDFEQAMGEEFAECVSPPVPFEDASAHECCEVIWDQIGADISPRVLAALTAEQIEQLRNAFGRYFECDSPSLSQIKAAIAATIARWPIDS